LDKAAFQDSKVPLLLPHSWEDFARVYRDQKEKKIIASLSFAQSVSNA